MNNTNNIFQQNEIENKLKDFTEGQDYSVSPTEEPNIKTYNFHNDRLRSVFRNDRIPVRVTQEAYDGKDYTYRGHFEEGKDYRYSAQQWHYDKDYQGNRGTDIFGNGEFKNFMDGIKWNEHSRIQVSGEAGNVHTGQKYWEGRWTYHGKGNLNGNNEPKKLGSGFNDSEIAMHEKYLAEFQEKKHFYEMRLIEEKECKHGDYPKRGEVMDGIRKSIDEFAGEINYEKDWLAKNSNFDSKPVGCCACGFKDISPSDSYCQKCNALLCDKAKKSDLAQENHELRQQLTEVQKQLAEVLAELKKLKNNSAGQNKQELDQQIVKNEQLIKDGEKVSEMELRKQVQKSEALLKGAVVNSTTSPVNDNKKDNGSLPYLIAGSAFVLVGIIGYYLVKKNRGKKVA